MKKFLLSIFAVMLAVFSVQAQTYVYKKVTSAPSDWSGDYLIVYEAGNVAFDGGLSTIDAASNIITVEISNNEIVANATTNAAKFTIDSNGIIRSASGYSIGQTTNANGLKASTSTNYTNTITFNNDGSANIVSGGAYLRYNSATDQKRFRYYKSSSYAGQKAIALYKYTEGGATEPETPVEPEEPETPVAPDEYLVPGIYLDEMDREYTGAENTTATAARYISWTKEATASNAVYVGQSAGGNDAIQLRSSNNNSGIVTTVSGGNAINVSINWQGASTRTLIVYGKNTPYESPADLYDSNKRGDELGKIIGGQNSTSVDIAAKGSYKYIGMRSSSGAMYLAKISITWEVEPASYALTVGGTRYSTLYLGYNAEIPKGVKAYVVSEVNSTYVELTEVKGIIPAKEAVIVEATPGTYNFVQTTNSAAVVEKNLLEGTLVDTNVTEEAYVLWNVNGEACFCKAEMNQLDGTSWMNNANKAYLPASVLPTDAQGAANFSFRFGEGTTAIENVEVENAVKAIYDLTGRKVEAITAPGIYIVNGKKVLVK